MRSRKVFALSVLALAAILFAVLNVPAPIFVYAQQPTGSIPTVTGTPSGPIVTVYENIDQVDVYAGPSSYDYPAVGVMLAGEQARRLHAQKVWTGSKFSILAYLVQLHGFMRRMSRLRAVPIYRTSPFLLRRHRHPLQHLIQRWLRL